MRSSALIILSIFFINHVSGQVSFSSVEAKLSTEKINGSVALISSGPAVTTKFQLNRNVTILQQSNFVSIDSQVIQIIPLQISGYQIDTSLSSQKKLLSIYSNYELAYLKDDLGLEVINPNNQWILVQSKGWFIWYFKVGHLPSQEDKQVQIQLYASTVIGNKILTINAPIFSSNDFTKAGLIVNDMMETLTIINK